MESSFNRADWDRYHRTILDCLAWMQTVQGWTAVAISVDKEVSVGNVNEVFGDGFSKYTWNAFAKDCAVLTQITEFLATLEDREPRLPGFGGGYGSWHELVIGYHRRMMEEWFRNPHPVLFDLHDDPGASIVPKLLLPVLIPQPTDKDGLRPYREGRRFRGVGAHLERESRLVIEHCNSAGPGNRHGRQRSAAWVVKATSGGLNAEQLRRAQYDGRLKSCTKRSGRWYYDIDEVVETWGNVSAQIMAYEAHESARTRTKPED